MFVCLFVVFRVALRCTEPQFALRSGPINNVHPFVLVFILCMSIAFIRVDITHIFRHEDHALINTFTAEVGPNRFYGNHFEISSFGGNHWRNILVPAIFDASTLSDPQVQKKRRPALLEIIDPEKKCFNTLKWV